MSVPCRILTRFRWLGTRTRDSRVIHERDNNTVTIRLTLDRSYKTNIKVTGEDHGTGVQLCHQPRYKSPAVHTVIQSEAWHEHVPSIWTRNYIIKRLASQPHRISMVNENAALHNIAPIPLTQDFCGRWKTFWCGLLLGGNRRVRKMKDSLNGNRLYTS